MLLPHVMCDGYFGSTVLDDHSKFKGYRTHNINLQFASYVF